jgi:tetratricopeptide (TPR) repeat protein
VPPISLAVPAVFGTVTDDLGLRPPPGAVPDLSGARMAYFPGEPERFVGRAEVMAAGSTTLAPGTRRAGVLVHGMAGAGKTACALELAYRHQDAFAALAYWEGPKQPDAVFGALEDLSARLDIQLGGYGFAMAGNTATVAELQAYLPRLTQMLEDNGLLLVLDNLEHLLDADGGWRDPRWAALIRAVTSHAGLSRVILTSRTRPADLDPAVEVLPIHALTLAETALLARELPGLRRLLGADQAAAMRGQPGVAADRDLLARTLRIVQGHPKLLELADAAAATDDPERLARHLDHAEQAAAGGAVLQQFFTTGSSGLDPEAFLAQLTDWTTTTAGRLPEPSRLLLNTLCCLEDGDRTRTVLEHNWADLWARLHRPGDPPDLDHTLTPLAAAALIHAETATPDHTETGDTQTNSATGAQAADSMPVRYRIHPGVVDAVRAATSPELRAAVDTELAAYWSTGSRWAAERPEGEATWLVAHAGLAAAPYLLRLGELEVAATLLQQVLTRDESPATVRAVIPALRHIADTTGEPRHASLLGSALAKTMDLQEAEHLLDRAYRGVVDADDHGNASTTASRLANLLQRQGRLREALQWVDLEARHARDAGLGPATQLAVAGHRLQILGQLGEHRQVLDEIHDLRPRLDQLPDQRGDQDLIEPWNVREATLDIGRSAAADLGEWETALQYSRDIQASNRRRGAGLHVTTCTRFNDYAPLIRLGRLDEADRLLQYCQQVFEDTADTRMLGSVLSARADMEDERGRPERSARFECSALRYTYAGAGWQGAAASHRNLAVYLRRSGADAAEWLPHQLASAVIGYAAQGASAASILYLARQLHRLGDAATATMPAGFADLAARVEAVNGVRFAALVTRLTGQPGSGDTLLADTLTAAREQTAEAAADDQALVASWEPRIAAVVAAAGGDTDAASTLEPVLTGLADNPDWGTLVGVLSRILAGERGPGLLTGLDPVDTAITARTLDALAGRVQLTATPAGMRPAVPEEWEPVLAAVVAAAGGDTDTASTLEPVLTGVQDNPDWARLVGVLRRILAGERGPDLLTGLDPVDTAITARTLEALAGRVRLTAAPTDLRPTGTVPEEWEPVIAAVVAAAGGDTDTAADLDPVLTGLQDNPDWRTLVGVLRRIIAGERGPDLLTGLDPVDTAITARTLDALAGRVQLTATPADLRPAATVPEDWEPVIAAVVAAASGDTDTAADLDPVLTDLQDNPDWSTLVPVLRRILAGERGPDLLTGLDPVDTAIAGRTLDALAEPDRAEPPREDPDD